MKRQSQVSDRIYRQDNPRDQLRVILGAMEGSMHAQAQGAGNPKQVAKRCIEFCKQAQELAKTLNEGVFDD
jgi:hypothetical protein